MRKRLAIKVTEGNIKEGAPGDSASCPIAWAIVDKFGPQRVCDVDVQEHSICFRLGGAEYHFVPEEDAIAFIDSFDNGQIVKPCVVHAELGGVFHE